jgi:NAD(P)-dependent dehydrogenase (short-subunit alcohol dehydrogenase family)
MTSANLRSPDSTRLLEGKVAVITGAGRGIGRAEALLMARHGAKIVVNDLGGGPHGGGSDSDIAGKVVDEIRAAGGEAISDTSDISSMAGGQGVVEAALRAFGRLDILSNNAGIIRPARIDEMTEQDWDLVQGVNLKGYFATIKAAAPAFIRQGGGVIINKGSPSGFGHYGMANYCAAKEGVVGLTRTVARDLGQFGVRCNVIRPMTADSNMKGDAVRNTILHSQASGYPGIWNRWLGAPQALQSHSDHVAALTVWLCLENTREVNGREFFVAGSELGILPEPELHRVSYRRDGWTLQDLLDASVQDYLVGDVRNRFGKSAARSGQDA